MSEKTELMDYTEDDFKAFLKTITDPEEEISEKALNKRINYFRKICGHPSGSDLIYWPEAEGLDTPEQITRIIKEWREVNGMPGFKPE